MDLTGVIPLPADSIRSRVGGGSGTTNRPAARPSARTCPGRTASWRKFDTRPPGWRLTVTAIVGSPGREERL